MVGVFILQWGYREDSVAEVATNVAEVFRWWNQVHGEFVFVVHISKEQGLGGEEWKRSE